MSPSISIPQLSKEEGISDVTLYNWRKQARDKGLNVPGKKTQGSNGHQKPGLLLYWKPPR